jgi:hypothetical protein
MPQTKRLLLIDSLVILIQFDTFYSFPFNPLSFHHPLLLNLGQKLHIPENRKLLLINGDLLPAKLRDQHAIALDDAHGDAFAVLVEATGAHGQHFALVELLDGRFGKENAAGGFGFGLDALHEHAVQQWDERADGFEGEGLLEGDVSWGGIDGYIGMERWCGRE